VDRGKNFGKDFLADLDCQRLLVYGKLESQVEHKFAAYSKAEVTNDHINDSIS
jgi:hypothetical protein